MGAVAFQKDLGAVHSCAHALSTVADLHHGLANGIMIDHVMRFNLPAATAKLAELAHAASVPGAEDGTTEARAIAFVAWLTTLKAALNIPARLADYRGARPITQADIPRLVDFYMRGLLDLDSIISETISLERINEGFDQMKRGDAARSVIVFDQ